MIPNINRMLAGYIECALWSSVDLTSDEDGTCHEFLDQRGLTVLDLDPDAFQAMRADCAAFIELAGDDIALYLEQRASEHLGHDFWLTRAGHGTGFWDRGLGALGDRLTAHAKTFGACELYVGDDGKVYVS